MITFSIKLKRKLELASFLNLLVKRSFNNETFANNSKKPVDIFCATLTRWTQFPNRIMSLRVSQKNLVLRAVYSAELFALGRCLRSGAADLVLESGTGQFHA